MDMNYFLKRLQAGEDMCDIGNEIAELMNQAQSAYDDEVRAKEEALAKELAAKKAKEAEKKELAKQICDLVGQYGALECPGLEGVFAVSEEDIDAFVKSMTDVFGMFKNLYAINDNLLANAKNIKVKVDKTDDDILNDFVKNFLV